jgi:hypothetical protein
MIDLVNLNFRCNMIHFPYKYLGVPLSIYELKKPDLQPLIDDVADHLPNWKAKLMSRA